MDKITRMLLLYSKLIRGEKINKFTYCIETDCLPRTFDRDIEDIRLYLSETFSGNELVYDRYENSYYLNGTHRKELEVMEYQLIERILLDTGTLRYDETNKLLQHIASNTNKSNLLFEHQKKVLSLYEAPMHDKALLKIHGDLIVAIDNQAVIKIKYTKMNDIEAEREVIPCSLKYDMGYLYLIAYRANDNVKYPGYFRLDRIDSFYVIRSQSKNERHQVSNYLKQYAKGITQMYGGEFTEIKIECKKSFYPYIHDKFRETEIIEDNVEQLKIRLWAFDEGFVKWILSQPTELIQIIEPVEIKEKIVNEANKLLTMYKEDESNGKN